MGLSSNILWHQTSKAGLMAILKQQEFKYSYSKESVFSSVAKGLEIAVPMISMCDLPFSELTEYIGKYGNYMIGLDANWGKRKGFTPVWYCYPTSHILEFILKQIKNFGFDDPEYKDNSLIEILKYIKFVEAPLTGHNYKSYRFMDEREVRLCPTNEMLAGQGLEKYNPLLVGSQYDEFKANNGNKALLNLSVDFDLSDVKYIVVKNKPNVEEFKKLLESKKEFHDIRIFSEQEIKEDFIGFSHYERMADDSNSKSEKEIKELLTDNSKLWKDIIHGIALSSTKDHTEITPVGIKVGIEGDKYKYKPRSSVRSRNKSNGVTLSDEKFK